MRTACEVYLSWYHCPWLSWVSFSWRGAPWVDSRARGFRWGHVMAALFLVEQKQTQITSSVSFSGFWNNEVRQHERLLCTATACLDYVVPKVLWEALGRKTGLRRPLALHSGDAFVSNPLFVCRFSVDRTTRSYFFHAHSGSFSVPSVQNVVSLVVPVFTRFRTDFSFLKGSGPKTESWF